MSKKCPECGGTNTVKDWYAYDQGICYVCADCCYVGDPEEFKEQIVFDRITESLETLAEVFMDLYDGNKCKYCAYKKSGMCSLKPRHEEYDEGGWVEDEDCIRGMIEYLKKEVKE